MPGSERLTVSIDQSIKENLIEYKKSTGKNNSKIVREALIAYFDRSKENSNGYDRKKARIYYDMLSKGEHIILDIDHWILFLSELTGENEKFWKNHKAIARSHGEQFSLMGESVKGILERLEACNFFSLKKHSDNAFTLVLTSELAKEFIKTFLYELFKEMSIDIEIKEDYSKLRLRLIKSEPEE